MARIELAPEIYEDFERIIEHCLKYGVQDTQSRFDEIIGAIDVLADSPLIGRPIGGDLRELVIGKEARGYLALYRYIDAVDTIFVLAIRSQMEAGYRRS